VIGRGGMTAAQFEASTPREIQWRIAALYAEDERQWERTAQQTAWILTAFGAKVSAKKLLGKPDDGWRAWLE
jgi:hypothetical protein